MPGYQPLVLALLMTAALPAGAQPAVAVLDFEAHGISAAAAATLTDRFRAELVRTGRFTVIERGAMEEVLREQGFQHSGCVSTECAVQIGNLLGARQMVAGSIGQVGAVFTVSVRIIDVQSGKIGGATTYDHTGDISGLLTQGMRRVVSQLSATGDMEPATAGQAAAVESVQTGLDSETNSRSAFDKTAAKIRITRLKWSKQVYAAGSLGAALSGGVLYYLAERNYSRYQDATTEAGRLHTRIEQQVSLGRIALGIGGTLAIPALVKHYQQIRLERRLAETEE